MEVEIRLYVERSELRVALPHIIPPKALEVGKFTLEVSPNPEDEKVLIVTIKF